MWEICVSLPSCQSSEHPLQMLKCGPDGCTAWCLVTSNHSLEWEWNNEKKQWENEKKMEQDDPQEDKLTTGNWAHKQHWVCPWRREKVMLWGVSPSLPPSVRRGSACCQCLVTWNLKINITLELNKAALTITGTRLMASSIKCVSMCVCWWTGLVKRLSCAFVEHVWSNPV